MSSIENTTDILKQSGWYDGRRIDVSSILKLLKERNFDVFQKVKEFLEQYAMLEIKVPSPHAREVIEKYNFREYNCHHTDVFKALGETVDYVDAQQFEFFASEKLVIVGSISDGNLFLMVSESGKVFCDSGKLGDNAWEAFETLCNPLEKRIVAWQYL